MSREAPGGPDTGGEPIVGDAIARAHARIPRRGRTLGGVCASLLALAVCLFVLSRLSESPDVAVPALPASGYALFYLSVGAIYFVSLILWRGFADSLGLQRSRSDALIDTGLLVLGKYVPGKVWGLVARGAVEERRVAMSAGKLAVSTVEQLFSLFIGVAVVCTLASAMASAVPALGTLGIAFVGLAVGIGALRTIRRYAATRTDAPSEGTAVSADLGLALGYVALWFLNAVPLLSLMVHATDLSPSLFPWIAAAFLGAMVAGWLAVFAPAGIGVREATFAWLAADLMSWEQGLYWVTLHRSLSLTFDLVFGFACLALAVRRTWHPAAA